MLIFDPPELQAQITAAIKTIEKVINITSDDLGDDLIDPSSADFDPADHADLTITPATELHLWLPNTDETSPMTYGEFVELADELKTAELIDGVEGWTAQRLLLRVDTIFGGEPRIAFESWLDGSETGGVLNLGAHVDGADVTCSLHRGSTLFGLLVVGFGYYDKYYPPSLPDEYFVEVRANPSLARPAMRAVADAYMFELASSLRLDLRLSPRPDADDLFPEDETTRASPPPPLRPLLLGPGIDAVLAGFIAAVAAPDPSFQLLGFVKVIEHVSQTVIRAQMTDVIRAKLLSPRALNPDATFILELESLVAEQRTQRKDREALRATVHACCDATELSIVTPPFLSRLRAVAASAEEKQRRQALDDLAGALTATRNWVAHAKAGYNATGEECPPHELDQFAVCARLAAEQCIRWYAARHESIRVV